MSIYNYSAADVVVNIAGIYQVEGFSNDSFITIRKQTSPYLINRTADGQISRSYKNDQSFTIEINLAQSSPSNIVLQTLHNLDIATQTGMFPLFIKDSGGTTTFLSTSTWISEIPQVSFSKDLTSRTWILHSPQGFLNIGGNANDQEIEEVIASITSASPLLEKLNLLR
jgi:hypothetical protein